MADDQAPAPPPAPEPSPAPAPAALSIDDTIESCIGFRQVVQAILVALSSVFDAQQTFINVFTDADPSWHCINSTCNSAALNPCGLRKGSWSWDRPKHTSIVSDWNLQCSSSAILGMPASAYFLGCLIGGLMLATLADSHLGRKNMLVLSCLITSLASSLAVLSPNVWVYSVFRFICGVGRATIGGSALVLAMEIVGKRWRSRVSVFGFCFFTLGFLSLPAIAYFGRASSWRNMYLWTSLPCFCYTVLIYFLVNESPRWLLVRGRKEEAINTLQRMAKSNGQTLDPTLISNLSSIVEENKSVDVFSTLKMLWNKRWMLKRLSAVMTVAFGVGMVYYGMPLNLGNLGSNLYISVALNALAEVPASLLTFLVIRRLNRRSSLLVLTTISGVTSMLCVFLKGHGLTMASELISFFCGCTCFNVLLIYSIELFPTCVRNSAVTMTRQALVFGGVFAPLLVAEGRKRSLLSFGVFGLAITCFGMFIICLPETRGCKISDTIEEEEHKKSNNSTASSIRTP